MNPGAPSRLVLPVAILASFVAFLDGTVVTVALPAITGELGGGIVVQQWVVDAYLVTLGAFILLAGSLSDALGRERIMMAGLLGFGVTSVACAVAPDALTLILARAAQGASGALLVPSSLALLVARFDGPAQSKAIGTWTAWTGLATIAGPVLGGLLVDTLSWRLVFAVNVIPIAVTVLLLRRLGTPAPAARSARIDLIGALLAAVGLGGTAFGLIEQSRLGWADVLVVLPLALGALCLVAFVLWERRASAPLLPLDLFRVRTFAAGNAATAFIYGAFSLGFFALAVFLQQVADYSATFAGLATLPPTVVLMLTSTLWGRLSGRYGPRLFMTVGPLVGAAGFALLVPLGPDAPYLTAVLPGMVVFGIGLAITVAPLTSAILGSVGRERAGIGSAVNNAVSRVAGLIAVALAGLIASGAIDADGFPRIAAVTAILLALGGVISFLGVRNPAPQP